ncbi:hypothetical protein AURDEDRAFT_178166 [Auricularia subglabra TFB-10046 SS5]|uniref:SUN domain-containing protein n=1 Tax=Auricularia subglabra (strain TFB-10046 / SS5) TaxID=717982 RepID=J0WLS5_AURST|nr:hypothetical protein AURDEDRAFT_178166 [Auricularia subglabra TFB-10046 SS5]
MAISPVAAFVVLLAISYLFRPILVQHRCMIILLGLCYGMIACSMVASIASRIVTVPASLAWSLDMPMFSKGARIIDAWTSPTYTPPGVNFFAEQMRNLYIEELVRRSHGPMSTPEIAIGLHVDPRSLWYFAGQRATLTVALPEPVLVESIRLRGHSTKPCLPRDVNVWGLVSRSAAHNIEPTALSWPSTGFPTELQARPDFGYNRLQRALLGPVPLWLPLAQLRDVPGGVRDNDYPVEDGIVQHRIAVYGIALEFRRNWGHDYSCFAGLGIAGNVE